MYANVSMTIWKHSKISFKTSKSQLIMLPTFIILHHHTTYRVLH